MILLQHDNFFPDLEKVRSQAFSIPLMECDEYNQQFNRSEDWPGRRSDILSVAQPNLNDHIHQMIHRLPMFGGLEFNCMIHYRGEGTEDWVHMDNEPLAGIIYINPTNYNSGTRIYDTNQQMVTDIKYVQNRLVMYSGGYLHSGYGHFGNTHTQGRTTINLFLKSKD